jgi:tetratricopeptide (TPR) repeat protein
MSRRTNKEANIDACGEAKKWSDAEIAAANKTPEAIIAGLAGAREKIIKASTERDVLVNCKGFDVEVAAKEPSWFAEWIGELSASHGPEVANFAEHAARVSTPSKEKKQLHWCSYHTDLPTEAKIHAVANTAVVLDICLNTNGRSEEMAQAWINEAFNSYTSNLLKEADHDLAYWIEEERSRVPQYYDRNIWCQVNEKGYRSGRLGGIFDADLGAKVEADLHARADAARAVEAQEREAAAEGVKRLNKGDYDGAIAYFNDAIRFYPKSAIAYNSRGNAY